MTIHVSPAIAARLHGERNLILSVASPPVARRSRASWRIVWLVLMGAAWAAWRAVG